MYLFIHATQRENASLMLVGNSKEFSKNKEAKKNKELVSFLTFDDVIVFVKPLPFRRKRSPDVLRRIDELLKKFTVKPRDLNGICVLSGPGQFSFLRTSVVTANTFGWALGIPIVGVLGDEVMAEKKFITQGLKKLSLTKRFCPVVPEYGKEPNITIAKKKI